MGTERRALMKLARRLLASRADAEDAVQDTYVRALAVFPDSVAPRPAWLYTVLRNIAIDRLRRKRSVVLCIVPVGATTTRHAHATATATVTAEL